MLIAQWIFDLFIPIKEIPDFSFHPPIYIAIATTIAIFTFVHRNGPLPRNMFLILFNILSLSVVFALGYCSFFELSVLFYKITKFLFITLLFLFVVVHMRLDGRTLLIEDILPP